MLYPRRDNEGKLVSEEQMVGVREHLATKRIYFLSGIITAEVESQNLFFALDTFSHEPIKVIISSPGGDMDTSFLLHDTIRLLKSPVITLGRYCASAAVLLLASGQERYLMPHAKVMLHLPAGQMGGDARDWAIQHQEMEKYKNKMVDILVDCGAKKGKEDILKDIDRDFWLEPEEAIEYGLADKIMTPKMMEKWLK